MSFIKGAINAGVAAKVLQIAQRELSKPENQRKAKDLLHKVQQRTTKR